MTSTNEEISPPPKPKTNPLEFRNTDLVSRLLAATPPYLYNMPLVPHSYFFSEMLRSLVQGKTEAASRMQTNMPHRRSRKRSWSHGRNEYVPKQQMSPNMKCDNSDMPPPNWTPKLIEKSELYETHKLERPLELTMNKIALNNNTKLCHTETQSNENRINEEISARKLMLNAENNNEMQHSVPPNSHLSLPFPPIPNLPPQDSNPSSDLILPPPPPIWYPPLYPTPYGIDPLHFFIDLRVSGHIYDRKNSKEHSNLNMNLPPHQPNHLALNNSMNHILDINNGIPSSTMTSSSVSDNVFNISRESLVKQSRHASAFSVPTPSLSRNDPINLSGNKYQKIPRMSDEKSKFDIKSMGFDTNSDNSKSTNYILKNLNRIYKDVQDMKHDTEGIDLTSPKQDSDREEEVNIKDEKEDSKDEEKDAEKAKKCKDLRALIGLELVVDYVKHEKPGAKQCSSESSITDVESNVSSPAVEVVTITDSENKVNL